MPVQHTLFRYWNNLCESPFHMAAICDVSRSAIVRWKQSGKVPIRSARLLALYFGEISPAQWEDDVDDRANAMQKAKSRQDVAYQKKMREIA